MTEIDINSATAGFLVHRAARLEYPFYEEGIRFSTELVEMLNTAQAGSCRTVLFEEQYGEMGRVHWLVGLRNPNDYKLLLKMIDHDEKWRQWAAMDRLPTRGGGKWHKIFVEGAISEHVMCPQHGVGGGHEDLKDDDLYFQPPARHQSALPLSQLIHSDNAAVMVHRSLRVFYQVREEARFYLFRWAQRITQALAGQVSAYTYEEMWGIQDRLHALIHFRTPDAVERLAEFEREDKQLRTIQAVEYAPGTPGNGLWHHLIVPGTVKDVVLTPAARR
jgi:hypothetical protein